MEQQKSEAGEMRIQYHDQPLRDARIKVIGVGGGGGRVRAGRDQRGEERVDAAADDVGGGGGDPGRGGIGGGLVAEGLARSEAGVWDWEAELLPLGRSIDRSGMVNKLN